MKGRNNRVVGGRGRERKEGLGEEKEGRKERQELREENEMSDICEGEKSE